MISELVIKMKTGGNVAAGTQRSQNKLRILMSILIVDAIFLIINQS
jgi:hypothetical protein